MSFSPEALEAFAQIVELGSFSAAARRLGKSQSTISEAIARLEIDLGVELFDRSTRQPVLTEAGKAMLGRVEDVLSASDRLRRTAGRLAAGAEPRLTLVLSDANQFSEFEVRMTELDQRFPELELECVFAEHGDAINLIQSGRASLGLLSAQASYPPEIGHATIVERADFGLFVAHTHPLAALEQVNYQQLSEYRALRLNTLIDHSIPTDDLPTSGYSNWSAPNYLLLMDMAGFGFGWSALPRWLVSRYASGLLKELKVPGWPRSSAVDVIWSRQRSLGPAGSWLLETLVPA
ncbi:LysR family transcriptional regulator [Pseudomonas cichorii]|uniref:LysR family transcriptional regulator n=1 Tax=Pseudomonas cichorii TaxID=36746 RepID=UPI001C89A60E|nr:LysR family transcriptional regulator [Pseudomonas cichorii]MBX8484021.1 LysR family transcriptional regulator [Pseudomonas cichorii]MBX8495916.1 LysR family transcriptional regulator [Pseudomonas cichorii]MBX8515084.1 LysR family transcriptional regulator [Pseudomonas cichorii]MBX8532868.1 LysR family transcriptional regulator [Pseudomonas cichorii]MBX8577514.1 LysR family transcriptional regulator [Pseudomonas cichorii]